MSKGFLSLKWQAVISVSLILVLGIGVITYYGKKNLEQNYLNHRQSVFQSRQQSVSTALKVMQLQMMHLASYMQGMARQSDKHSESVAAGLIATLRDQWDHLNFEWGLDSISFYDQRGEPLLMLGLPYSQQLLPMEWITSTGASETPTAQVWCYRSCWQVVVVPVLLDDADAGIMVFIQSLADALLQFQSSTAADVGILMPVNIDAELPVQEIRSLDNWKHNVIALTGAPATYNMLKELSQQIALTELAANREVWSWQQKNIEVSLIPLTELEFSRGASLVVLDDVSGEVLRLESTISNLTMAAVAILILAEVALLGMLWTPMSRLKVVAHLLPELARGDRRGVIERLRMPPKQQAWMRNEIHELFGSALLLSETLEELDSTVKNRTKGLKIRSRELLEQRNFVTSLLNNVHAIILTQNAVGAIQLLNAEGARLLDITADRLSEHSFSELLEPEERDKVSKGLAELFSRSIDHFRHESYIESPVEGPVYVEWYHTKLPQSENNEGLVLSVGLNLTARKQAESNLAWLADHDPLTELLNRRRFTHEFESILKRSNRFGTQGALIFFDIDQFKAVNDTSGHPVGDWLLCEVAHKLSHGVREVDLRARLGGDEFALVVENVDKSGAIALAEKLCKLIGGTEINLGNSTHRITISLGIALFPEHGASVDELMSCVDLAMYKAKASFNARSNWCVYSSDAPDLREMRERVDWKARIQKALDEERYVLYYQPILDLSNDEISHYEALVRMLDEKGSIVPPGMFIPVAEKTGLIYDIDRLVLKKAIIELKGFHERGEFIKIAVNLSATAIASLDFIDTLEALVKEYQIDRSSLIFELTETSAVEDLVTTASVIGNCRKLGYRFSLDDFGVGFSSWYYLRQLPVDFVKIDGSFVRNLSDHEEDRLFVKAINEVAKGLGKQTIAEYVENAESLQLLRDMGVNYAQGYYIGKPQPQLLRLDKEQADVTETKHAVSINKV